MKKEKIKTILITSAITFFCTILLIAIVTNVKNNSEVSSLKNTNEVKNKQFAVMLQNESGGYAESESSSWPTTGYELNTTLTNCTDETGTKLENVLRYENGNIAVKSNKKLYCYLYFDSLSGLCTSGSKLGSCLIEKNNKINSLDDTAYGGMYRYTGTNDTVNNNYICFGTDDKEECLNNPETYMYRMIGVTSEANDTLGLAANQVKVIKAASIGNYNWHTSYTSDTKWESSAMYTYLQGSSVLGSTSVVPSGWSDKISSIKWNIGDVQTYTNGDTVYGLEDNTQTTNTSKVGLMYLSDYYYAYNAGGTTICYSTACTNWLTDTSNHTWTMSLKGYDSGYGHYTAWYVHTDGRVGRYRLNDTYAVRPVFYLNSDEVFVSGMGTEEDPIMLGEPELTAGDILLSNPTTGLNTSTSYAGLYRYIGTGTAVNNYVKLGDVLYRIIGITSEDNTTLGLEKGQLKLIKAETIGTYNWHTSQTSDTKWESSAMYTYLQNDVLSNTSYIPSGWSDKISSVKWNVGDVTTYSGLTGSTVYGLEDTTQTTNTSKVGLMYLSDYYYAYNVGGTQNCNSSPYCVSWMTDTSNNYTWTMTRYGDAGYYRAWILLSNGRADMYGLTYTSAARPVFYLNKDVYITNPEATGTSADPFIIN